MPYITQGTRTYVYAIKLRLGRIRNYDTDPNIFIGMSGNKRIPEFIDYFTNQVSEDDSINHQTVRARLMVDPNEVFYVKLLDRFKYNAATAKRRVVQLQNRYGVEIPYPP